MNEFRWSLVLSAMRRCLLTIVFLQTLPLSTLHSEDWYRFRGPRLDGVSSESASGFCETTPRILWKANVGTGLSSVAIQNGRLYTVGNRENVDTVVCLDARSGKEIWKHSYSSPTDPNEFEGGPTSTPTVDGDHVYTISRQGDVHCFDAKSGRVVWSVNVAQLAQVRIPAWGFSGSPLVFEDLLVLNVGDAGTALEKTTGELVWKSADKDSGYSSMVPFAGDKIVFGSARSYVCVDALTGHEVWRQRWLTTFGCNAADPIVSKDKVFLSSGYNRGSALLKIDQDAPEVVWKHKDFQNQLSSSVLVNGFLYGVHGDVDEGASLRCIKHSTGEVQWTSDEIRVGTFAATRDHLLVLSDSGELMVTDVSGEEFVVRSHHQILEGKCWTTPVLSNGYLYCRDTQGNLVCLGSR